MGYFPPLALRLISPCSGPDCVKSLWSSYTGLYLQTTEAAASRLEGEATAFRRENQTTVVTTNTATIKSLDLRRAHGTCLGRSSPGETMKRLHLARLVAAVRVFRNRNLIAAGIQFEYCTPVRNRPSPGTVLNLRTTPSQKCAAVPRRAHI